MIQVGIPIFAADKFGGPLNRQPIDPSGASSAGAARQQTGSAHRFFYSPEKENSKWKWF